jgi:hypothetical protein
MHSTCTKRFSRKGRIGNWEAVVKLTMLITQ